jgi:hypothetical protein
VPDVTDHGMSHSIDFFEPNGHRVELACPDPEEEAMIAHAGRLENGDTVILRACCERPGYHRIGFGGCAGTVLAAREA